MKITYMNHATIHGPALYAILKDDKRDMQVLVPDQSTGALRDAALEMRERAERELERAAFIERAADQLDRIVPSNV